MNLIFLHNKKQIGTFLLKHRHLNYYHLGDLDDFFWPYTSWFALEDEGEIKALNLFYTGIDPAVLLAIVNDNYQEMEMLLKTSLPILPPGFYTHLSPGLENVLEKNYSLEHHGEHYKMKLVNMAALEKTDTAAVVPLTTKNLDEMKDFYQASYPGNWFVPRMLETGQYVGIRGEREELVSVAGIHVYSTEYKIAAIGNITTQPNMRGQGLGTTVTAGLCKKLLKTVDMIGLNVRSDNAAAIRVYEKIGFEVVAMYHEWMVDSR